MRTTISLDRYAKTIGLIDECPLSESKQTNLLSCLQNSRSHTETIPVIPTQSLYES